MVNEPSFYQSTKKVSFHIFTLPLMKHYILYTITTTVLFIATACSSSQAVSPSNPLTNDEVSAVNYSVTWLDNSVGFLTNQELNNYLNQKILPRLKNGAAPAMMNQNEADNLTNLKWQIYTLNSDNISAFSIGNGVIVISKGLFKSLISEAEVAAIIAHEMSHQILGDTRTALNTSMKENKPQVFYFPIENELAADKLAISILYNAKYPLSASLTAFPKAYRLNTDAISGNNNAVNEAIINERITAIRQALQKQGLSALLQVKGNTTELKTIQQKIK